MISEEKKIKSYFTQYWKDFKNIHLKQKHFSSDVQGRYFTESHGEFLSDIFSQIPGRFVLNLGCGKGTHSLPLEKRGFRVVNIDYVEGALTLTKEFYEKEKKKPLLVMGDINFLPFKPESFDIVVNFGLMEHFKDIQTPYKQMVNVLKRKGIFHSEVITKRFSIHTIERFMAILFSFLYNLLTFRLKKLIRLIKIDYKKENFYENSFSQEHYLKILHELGIGKLCCIGIRPYPYLRLPRILDNLYARILKPIRSFCNRNQIRLSKSMCFKKWCAVWLFYGVKA